MSYCRWSTDDHSCDAYVYETRDGWSINLAGNRFVGEVPKLPKWGTVSDEEFIAARRAQMSFISDAKRIPINLPRAGESIICESPGACAVMLKELIEIGYNIPQWVIGILLEEQVEMDLEQNTIK